MKKRLFVILLALQLAVCNEEIIYATQIPQAKLTDESKSEADLDILPEQEINKEILSEPEAVTETGREPEADSAEDVETVSGSDLGLEAEYAELDEIPPLTYRGDEEYKIQSISELGFMTFAESNLESKYISPYITSAKNQKSYGICWAFSCVAASEANLVKKNIYDINEIDLSEWHLAYFITNQVTDPLGLTEGDSFSWKYSGDEDYLSHGGNQQYATYRLANWVGLADEEKAKYSTVCSNRNASIDNSLAYDDKVHLENSYWVSMQDQDEVKKLIKEYGACSASYWHEHENNKNPGKFCNETAEGDVTYYNPDGAPTYYDDKSNLCYRTNHAITIIGWDDNFSSSNFKEKCEPDNNGAWYCKNSWGTGNLTDNKGCFWISYDELSLLYSNAYFYDCVSSDNYDYNYHYDGGIGIADMGYSGSSTREANIYKAQSNEFLKAVGFYTNQPGYVCEVNVYKGCREGEPLSGECVATIEDIAMLYAGFHTVELEEPISLEKDEIFSVVVRHGKLSDGTSNVRCTYSLEGSGFKNINESKLGQSFIISDSGRATDIGANGQNWLLKAYTDAAVSVSEINLNQSSAQISHPGGSIQLQAEVLPENAGNKKLKWQSSNEKVVTVNEDGLVKSVGAGTATVTATATDGSGVSASCEVTVIQKVTGITLSKTSTELNVGETELLSAEILPPNAENKSIAWSSSNNSVATVDATGKITAVKAGTATITASAKDGSNVSASCTVTVKQKVTGITLSKTSTVIYTGSTETLTATVSPSDASNRNINWSSSDTKIATVSSSGKITAVKAGVATIKATAADGSGVFASCSVTVKQKVTGITLSKTEAELYLGKIESLTLSASVLPADASDKSLIWGSSDSTVATVDDDGKITALKTGSTTITATAKDGSNVSASCEVTVYQPMTGIVLSDHELELDVGDNSKSLTVTPVPENANNKAVNWSSSDEAVVTVAADGMLTPKAPGTAVITAASKEDDTISDQCTIIVKQKITGITLTKTSTKLYVGDTETLTATVLPENANDKSLIWSSSDEEKATVDENGKVTALKAGTTTITVTAKDGSGKTASCTVIVKQKVAGITLSKTSTKLYPGDSETLTVTVLPDNASDKRVDWRSSHTSVAKVDSTGKLTAVSPGKATVTVSSVDDPAVSVTCTVTVTATKTGTSGDITWSVNTQGTLSYEGNLSETGEGSLSAILDIAQEHADKVTNICIGIPNLTDITGIFEQFPSLSEIDLSGCDGAKIANAENAFDQCSSLTKVTLPSDMEISIDLPQIEGKEWKCENNGQICQNTLANYDQTATYVLVNKEKTEDEKEKPVDPSQGGNSQSPSSGNDKKLSVPEKKKVSAIFIIGLSNKVAAGKKLQLTAEVSPSDAANKGVVWSVDNSKYATVSAQGVVTAKKDGAGKSVTVTATAADGSGVTGVYKITIMKDAVTSVKITSKAKTVNAGKSIKLKVNIKTSGKKVNKGLKWISSNTDYATVNKSGKVTTKKAGKGKTVTITAQATDGSNKKAKIKIKIK